MVRSVVPKLVFESGPGSDERHVAVQHIQELRQLIEAQSAQDRADARNAWIVSQLVQRFAGGRAGRPSRELHDVATMRIRRGCRRHGPEFQDRERHAEVAEPALAEQHWAPAVELDRGCD
jgi:hypothetical protein